MSFTAGRQFVHIKLFIPDSSFQFQLAPNFEPERQEGQNITAMFHTQQLIAILSLGIALVVADDYVKCETSDGSPPVNGCQLIADGFKQGADPGCAQPYGSGCQTEVSNNEGCAFVLCMQDGTEPQCSDPASAATFTQKLIDQCQSNGKIGGYYHQDLGDGHYLNYEFVAN